MQCAAGIVVFLLWDFAGKFWGLWNCFAQFFMLSPLFQN
jgi:hypothetical protein